VERWNENTQDHRYTIEHRVLEAKTIQEMRASPTAYKSHCVPYVSRESIVSQHCQLNLYIVLLDSLSPSSTMVHFTHHQSPCWALCLLLAIWVTGSTAQDASAYPNPFAPKPAVAPAQQPVASQPPPYPNPFAPAPDQAAPPPNQAASQSASGYPNPFTSQAAGGTGAAAVQPSASGYPNPFLGTGGTGVTGATGGSEPGKNAASLDPANPAGTCCCDPKKAFVAASSPPPAGGCCAKGNKWACSCQDGGAFAFNPLACPVLHRNTRITPLGPKFDLFCNVQTHRKDIRVEPAESFIECVDACGATPGCVGVDYVKSTKQCHLKSEYMDENTQGAVNNDVDSASMPPVACPDISKCYPLYSRCNLLRIT
jgi:PAN domain